MELAAVGLAGNIVQFVQFGCELLSTTVVVLRSVDGISTQHGDLHLIAEHLKRHCVNLKVETYSDPNLVELAKRSQAAAEELLTAVNAVRLDKKPGDSRIFAGFRKALKGIWSKEKIESLSTRLDRLRDAIILHLTVQTRDLQTKIQRAMSNNHDETILEIHRLSQKFAAFIQEVNGTSQNVQANETSSYDLQKAFSEFVIRFEDTAQTSSILISLQFQFMGTRHEQIHEAYKETFEWVFNASGLPESDPRSRITYSSWLAGGEGIYWITGKPGSGKSTLMKFLQSHAETTRLLEIWAGPSRLVRANFYFWNAGTSMQKSLQGLLQSLLSAILKDSPDLIKVLCKDQWGDGHISTEKSRSWSLRKLKACFERIMALETLPAKFYFHIDGLDEYDGDHFEVIDIVRQLSQCPMIKICVSSRPWNCFHQTIGKGNAGVIYLHELTQKDIQKFAAESIIAYTGDRYTTDHEHLIRDITKRAQGVFLWVRVVVKSLRDGITNDDPVSLLRERLNQLPADLEELYEVIIKSVDPVYRKSMAYTLLFSLECTSSPFGIGIILHYSFIDEYADNPIFAKELGFKSMSAQEISRLVIQTGHRLNGRFKGLLEPCSVRTRIPEDASISVQFLHRTLKDFLQTVKMQNYLKAGLSADENISSVILDVLLANWKVRPSFERAISAIRWAYKLARERKDPTIEFAFFDHIEEMFELYDTTYSLGGKQAVLDVSVRFGERNYILYRLQCGKVNSLDNLLFHAFICSDTAKPDRRLMGFPDAFQKGVLDDNSLEYCEGGVPFLMGWEEWDMMKEILDYGANPNAIVRGIRIWETFLTEGLLTLMESIQGPWWDMFHQMVIHGANVKENTRIWIDILRYGQIAAGEEVLSIIKAFSLLLQYGLEPNARSEEHTIWQEALKMLFWTKDVSDIELVKDLLRAFLRQGADVTAIFHASVTSHCNRSFLEEISHAMQEQEIMLGGLWPVDVFEICFGHGLDPNFIFNGTSLWETILSAVKNKLEDPASRTPERLHRIKNCLITFLQYGADPSVDILQNLVSGHSQPQCAFSRADARELRGVMVKEIEHRESQYTPTIQNRRSAPGYKRSRSPADLSSQDGDDDDGHSWIIVPRKKTRMR
ncbi:hypothetical protein BU24DRAFT_451385 [Aaosphaeria arxii CBS 175.79]|uniref:NACHT domain-containing protein n=1 Tax=Aaosphaeria arxii CBS 175.79 TaxID=1450172 RepID=A0A6A5XN01_9PLEO|nr:uncharacterized protein BU24DRAFT_451385 [Aaosphaeria arxii CBS 175.79]KAF2014296.1 hypothetical protein BU24DRAFT_451385 [Aaosphaeria arxii CBS 175.79]